eukprot:CAMPEP_0117008156 /NCGR_PEP_ID=MMETSP0472-20121206/7772_1 /TAXON_ID=693140 ORGANISM="Tiarina fusus, Strain LIS" /NCGR_SAMPLE_ID=MMETSP0472 /ASSEMBLY_ACC=CAM_ASM_000603 /LENGTH=408 /DNA_ID=CAMNT_0004710115 /DNA_START=47 /DNA_END=1273 /DNA_ORIENTATION=-
MKRLSGKALSYRAFGVALLPTIMTIYSTTAFQPHIGNSRHMQQHQQKTIDPTFVLNLAPNGDFDFEKWSTSTKETVARTDSSASIVSDLSLGRRSLQHTLNVDSSTPLSEIQRRPWIVGHRGCLYDELENTREGFMKSADMGADAVELDVFLLKCGTLIVFHGGGADENPGHLLDYCGVNKGILELTYAEALELTFNPNYSEFGCPASKTLSGWIPTLEQVLIDAKESGLHVKVELKGPGTVEPTLEVVERLDMTSQCSYASFDKDRIAHLRRLRPDKLGYPTGALFNDVPQDYIEQAERAGATEIHLRYDTCTKDTVSDVHQAGFGSMAWFRGPIGMASDCQERFWDVGNEDESMYDLLLRTGVQQMCVNRPDVLVRYRQKILATYSNEDLVVMSDPQPMFNTTMAH